MREAATILGILRDRGRRRLPIEDVYRQLYNPNLYLLAYGKLARNAGALTPGVTRETADGMTLATIERIIALLREERYRWTPVRRVRIPKQNGKLRPLGIPTWSDKLLQEVLRLILEAYYEPQFSDHSHGFRPGRGCHTALREISRTWKGTTWFIEGDIKSCFDTLDHEVLLDILGEQIHDNRFLRLIRNLLRAGYLEDWRYGRTLSGTPQGGVVSPVLANIYLDRLDQFVERELIPACTRGELRARNPAYVTVAIRLRDARRRGDRAAAKRLHQQLMTLPSGDPHDTQYRRLRYVRYADDFVLGFAGPRVEAEEITRRIGEFLRDRLKLEELSEDKTLITHGRTQAARFLGYDLVVHHNHHKQTRKRRSITGMVGLRVPPEVVRQKCRTYLDRGRPIQRAERLHDSAFSIIAQYDREFRGLVEYYRLADNLGCFRRLKWVMETSLTKTLANKYRLSVPQVYRRYHTAVPTPQGPRSALQVVVPRDGKAPLVATWGAINLGRDTSAVLNDRPTLTASVGTELVERLLADTCELCGSHEQVEVHHIRALKELDRPGRATRPRWKQIMAARRRKTLVVCHGCHLLIHRGERFRSRSIEEVPGEPDDAKGSRPVREGAL